MTMYTAVISAVVAAATALTVVGAFAAGDKAPDVNRTLDHLEQRAAMLNCIEGNVDRFDDRLSPADVVASAIAWHCEADGEPAKYWIILSMRRTTPDTVDMFYRDLALPFVLQARARRNRS
ncbi:MAG TPA: hypothetical protein VE999_13735 [Gemmataceae bacterium]|jgi:hypothetical protein|nr:hypothetical protein [Gemmataceae bacterium]